MSNLPEGAVLEGGDPGRGGNDQLGVAVLHRAAAPVGAAGGLGRLPVVDAEFAGQRRKVRGLGQAAAEGRRRRRVDDGDDDRQGAVTVVGDLYQAALLRPVDVRCGVDFPEPAVEGRAGRPGIAEQLVDVGVAVDPGDDVGEAQQ